MTVQANWFVDLGVVDDEPFGPREAGVPIDLTGDAPELSTRLVALCHQEAALAAAGTVCAVKDAPDSTCSACPLRHTDPLDPATALCNVGVATEQTLTRIAILRVPGQAAAR